jgi:hypothetical protein
MLFISSVNCCLATKPSSLVMFAAVDSLGKKSMSMSTIDKTDLITKSIQKYRCKTRTQENTIVSLRKRVKATKQEKNGNDEFKAIIFLL